MGERLSTAAFQLLNVIQTSPDTPVSSLSRSISLPARRLPDMTIDEAERRLRTAKQRWEESREAKESGDFLYALEEYELLKELIDAAADDVAKASGGNKAAGTRVRKAMQDIKDAAQTVRKKILEVRSQQTV